MNTLWGIDLGGTKIEGVIMPVDPDEPLFRMRIDTEADQGYEHIVERIGVLIDQIEEKSGMKRPSLIGVGTPGAEEPSTGLMKNCNTTCLNGQPLPADMAAVLGTEVAVANDANCLALAEATLGAAKGAETVFGVIMGTGVGGGLVVHGRVLNGAQGIAGEWGHNVLIPDGELCYCGKKGCVEMVISGPRLQKFYTSLSGQRLTLKQIVDRVDEDPAAKATMDRLIHYFGQGIAVVINIFDPHMIVLGGGVGNIAALYTEGAKAAERDVFNTRMYTKIVRPLLGDSAGVFGAAKLAHR
jgi:predicted NBD/HSP70 family sugar kinase